MTGMDKVRLILIGVFLVLAALILWYPLAAVAFGFLLLAALITGQLFRAFFAARDILRHRPVRKPVRPGRSQS